MFDLLSTMIYLYPATLVFGKNGAMEVEKGYRCDLFIVEKKKK